MRRGIFLTSAAVTLSALAVPLPAASAGGPLIAPPFGALERRTGGRLGVFAIDTGSGRAISHRANERFPMCSTFKLLAVSAVLARIDAGHEHLDRRVAFGKDDLLAYAPITTAHVGAGFMTVGDLCASAIEYSDNTAANLLLETLGGPPAVTRYARSLGDPITRLDRNEPSLNTAVPGDVRDTTTPAAMATDMRELVLGRKLSPTSMRRLSAWMVACTTGYTSIRAGVPASWSIGDKTGSGDHGTRNDVAVLWPPTRRPIIVAAYLTGATVSADDRDGALAEVGHIVSRML